MLSKQRVQLIASDLDGTLLNPFGVVSDRTILALQKVMRQGIHVVVASGRTEREMRQLLAPLHLEEDEGSYFISYNGARTAKANDGSIVEEVMFSAQQVNAIIRQIVQYDVHIHVFCRNHMYVSSDLVQLLKEDSQQDKDIVYVDMHTYIFNQPCYKLLIYEDENTIQKLSQELSQHLPSDTKMFTSHKKLLEFVPMEGTKGGALTRLCQRLGVPLEEVVAFGDEENDISMLQSAGMGVAMSNAIAKVKQNAKYTTTSNEHDGVAEIIESIFSL
ncbi:MAG: HAD family hydrolase [Candidatus Izemoplasmatales bacterium]|nr:HAD family hydrolase [Candidatus Izemoplasmatales bacterium]